jgi:hypothetical protein
VKKEPACVQRATQGGAGENVDNGSYDDYPEQVAANEVWCVGLPGIEEKVKICKQIDGKGDG